MTKYHYSVIILRLLVVIGGGLYVLFLCYKEQDKGDIYKGISKNPSERIVRHNQGRTQSIRAYIPYELVYLEDCGDVVNARKREKYYKTGRGREELDNKIK